MLLLLISRPHGSWEIKGGVGRLRGELDLALGGEIRKDMPIFVCIFLAFPFLMLFTWGAPFIVVGQCRVVLYNSETVLHVPFLFKKRIFTFAIVAL